MPMWMVFRFWNEPESGWESTRAAHALFDQVASQNKKAIFKKAKMVDVHLGISTSPFINGFVCMECIA